MAPEGGTRRESVAPEALRLPDRFRFRRYLGRGGGGVVVEAFDCERDEVVALKTVPMRDADRLLLLKNEFRIVQDIIHPNLVRLGELFEAAGQWFFTMERLEGAQLLDYIHAGGGEARLRDALLQLARAISVLHASQVIHRDVKPANVIVTEEGRVVLLDFGIAQDLMRGARPLDLDSGIAGTVAYMSPEQIVEEGEVSSATDWYAFGTILFEALAHRLPFSGLPHVILAAKVSGEAPDLEAALRDAPEDLASLCIDLLRADPHARPSDAQVLERLGDSGASHRIQSSSRLAVFVGRGAEMEALDAAFESVVAGVAVTAVVEGESGVGKTYLVRRFLDRIAADHPDAPLFQGRCYERESVPYKGVDGVIDDIAAAIARMDKDERRALLPRGAHALAQLFPILGEAMGTGLSTLPEEEIIKPSELRLRAFGILRELLRRFAMTAPLLLSIDDFQWADADSLALLSEVMRPPDAPRLMLLLTVRTSTELTHAVATALPGDVRAIPVGKLPQGDARELARRLLGDEAGARGEEVAALVEDSGGHPLFLDELARRGGRVGAPVRLDDALWARVEALDVDARRLVQLASVSAGPVPASVAAAAAALSPAQMFRAITVARAARLIRGTGGDDETLDVYHDRIRASALARLDDVARAGWHARLAVALEQHGGDLERLADHWLGAGRPDRAASYTVAAADRAAAALAFEHAATLYDRALALGPAKADVHGLRSRLADSLTNAGHAAKAAEVRLAMAKDAPPAEALDLRRQAAEQFLCSGHFDRGKALISEVLADVGVSEPRSSHTLLARLMVYRARLRLRGYRFRERDVARVPPHALARVDVLRSAAAGFAMTDLVRGACFQAQATLAALDVGEPHRAHRALAFEAIFLGSDVERNAARIDDMLALLAEQEPRLGTPEARAFTGIARGYTAFNRTEFEGARTHFLAAETIVRDQCLGLGFELASVRVMIHRTLINLGAFAELARHVPPVQRDIERRGDLYALNNLRATALPLLALTGGRPDEARAIIGDANAALTHSQLLLPHVFLLATRLQTDLYLDDAASAWTAIEGMWPALERSLLLRVAAVRTFAHGFRARCAIALAARSSSKRREELLAKADRSIQWVAHDKRAWNRADAAMVSALALRLRGRKDEALAAMRVALQGFTERQMGLFAAAARWRVGEWIGGDTGAAYVDQAAAALRAEGVVEPSRMVSCVAPRVG